MSNAAPIVGTCPFCGADISAGAVLIEYETDAEMQCFAECSECETPVQPQ